MDVDTFFSRPVWIVLFVAEFLVVGAIAWAIATGIRIVVAVDGFLAECFGKIFQGG